MKKAPTYRQWLHFRGARVQRDAFASCSTESNKLYNIWLFGEGVEAMSQKYWGRVWVVVALPTRLPINGFNSCTARGWDYGSSSILHIDDCMNSQQCEYTSDSWRRGYRTMNKSMDSRVVLPGGLNSGSGSY